MQLNETQLITRLKPRSLRYHSSTDTTNDDALAWLHEGAAAGSVVIADEQRKGRGRMGRTWHTPPGVAIALSYILKPEVATLNRVSMLGALAVAELCEHLDIEQVGIKYPNDVQIDGRKVCGVLPEAAWKKDKLLGVVLGMGINVRVSFTDELAQTAVNLETAAGKPLDRADLIAKLLERLDVWSQCLGSDEFFAAWQQRLTTIGKTVSIGQVQGVAERVDSDGALMVRTSQGRLERVIAGDVMILGSNG
jgi:BirA family transcriptional regulator, biotin operon repressor / biotin---[acetyl-CoA-carboxylase] ligase